MNRYHNIEAHGTARVTAQFFTADENFRQNCSTKFSMKVWFILMIIFKNFLREVKNPILFGYIYSLMRQATIQNLPCNLEKQPLEVFYEKSSIHNIHKTAPVLVINPF